jgi:tRNA1(Val) A37 N6-methylase TrmN6
VSGGDLTHDAFMGGRVRAWQPRRGYRAGNDPVLLAAACGARPGDSVLELGSGAGVASLCLAARVPEVAVTAVERQPLYADLARRNVAEAGAPVEVIEADLAELPAEVRQRSFHHVIANPPYFRAGAGTAAGDAGREAALREETPLSSWIEVAAARLRPGGWLTMIQVAERLPEVLGAMTGLGSVSVLPLQPREGRSAGRVLLRARKGGRAPFRLLPPLVLHVGAEHVADGDSYAPEVAAVLRDGGALDWF